MNYSTYRITLDVRKTVSNVQLTAKKGDAGRKVYITLSDKGKPCEIADGLYAVFAGVKPDGTLLYNKTTIENNTIIYEMTQQTTAVPGLVACEVKLFDSMSNLLTSPKLTILVDDVVVPDEEIVSQNEITALAELILDATASSHFATEAANAAIAAAGNAQAATESANGAAASANQAAEGASTAASNANTAAGKATTEASKATQATEKANLATTNANNAASDARAATEETNTARENIVQTTGEILTSLSNAVYAPSIECLATGDVVAVNDASNQLLHGLTLYGKTTQNGTPTPEAPVELVSAGASGAIKTTVVGKNLCPKFEPHSITSVQVTPVFILKANTDYTLSAKYNSVFGNGTRLYVQPESGNAMVVNFSGDIAYTFNTKDDTRFYLQVNNGANISNTSTVDYLNDTVQLELGEVATAYEAPKTAQTLTTSTPNGLPGIPVSSGGNYTDANGQPWICDEVDFARGVYVKRIDRVTADTVVASGEFSINSAGMPCINIMRDYELGVDSKVWCNCYAQVKTDATGAHGTLKNWQRQITIYDNRFTSKENAVSLLREAGFAMLLRLAKPSETALSPEELAAYAVLHTNKPNTTVYNDAGAGLAVEYVADTKTYIDNKFTELQNAILSAGANI